MRIWIFSSISQHCCIHILLVDLPVHNSEVWSKGMNISKQHKQLNLAVKVKPYDRLDVVILTAWIIIIPDKSWLAVVDTTILLYISDTTVSCLARFLIIVSHYVLLFLVDQRKHPIVWCDGRQQTDHKLDPCSVQHKYKTQGRRI